MQIRRNPQQMQDEIDADIKYEVKHGGKPRPDREVLPREIKKQVRHELEEK